MTSSLLTGKPNDVTDDVIEPGIAFIYYCRSVTSVLKIRYTKANLGLDHHNAVHSHPVDESKDVNSRLILLPLLLLLLLLVHVIDVKQ